MQNFCINSFIFLLAIFSGGQKDKKETTTSFITF